ncbi:TetR/AcrR family transcriptional regulator [Micrococcus luteus]|uniref:TetR/AcrR family transcriptional regulator n=1 Tax=Micrococcus luteus TaxID=1270 RepID=UPI0011AA713C|nr:TetR/AcrR family transcriptional regulator [Micrococcus luteus]
MNNSQHVPGSARPGGRTARTREAVLTATRDLLVEQGASGMRVELIAARSGVHRSSIYRRWGGPAGIAADLAGQLSTTDQLPREGVVEGDLEVLAGRLAAHLTGDGAELVRALLAWQDPEVKGHLAAFWEARIDDVAAVLRRHGSAADPRLITRLLAGPIHYQALIEGREPQEVTVRAAVTAALSVVRDQRT